MREAEKITIFLTIILIALLSYNMLSPKQSDKLIAQQIKLQQLQVKKLDSINQAQQEVISQNRLVIQLLSNIDIEVTK
ncbi:MAG: hypothetical protein ACOVNU_03080 [Candidatus Kapaibacteriota bacterium]